MNQLYNSKVIRAQTMRRQLGSSSSSILSGFVAHSGTVVTLADGSRYLIHHGDGYAAEGHNPTVITPASNMSSAWQPIGASYQPNCTVGHMMGNGKPYNTKGNNCHDITASHPNVTVRVVRWLGYSVDIVAK